MSYPYRLTTSKYVDAETAQKNGTGTKTDPYPELLIPIPWTGVSSVALRGIITTNSCLNGVGTSFYADGFTLIKDIAYIGFAFGVSNITSLNDFYFQNITNLFSSNAGGQNYPANRCKFFNCGISTANPLSNNVSGTFNYSLFVSCSYQTATYNRFLFRNCTIYGAANDFYLHNSATTKNTIISNHNVIIAVKPTLPDYLFFDVTNCTFTIDGTLYAVGAITSKAELQAAIVAEFGGSLTDCFNNSGVVNPKFVDPTRNIFLPTNTALYTASDTGSYVGCFNPNGESLKVTGSLTTIPTYTYFDYLNGTNVNAATKSLTQTNTSLDANANSSVIYFPLLTKLENMIMFRQNSPSNKTRVDSTKMAGGSALDFAALIDGSDYVVGTGGVTINSTDSYLEGEVYRFVTGDAETTGNPDYFLITESRETVKYRWKSILDLGIEISPGTSLTVGNVYIVYSSIVIYNGKSYAKGKSFEVVTGVTEFTGGTVKLVFLAADPFFDFAEDLSFTVTTSDDLPLEENISNLQYSNGDPLYQSAVDGGKTEHSIYCYYLQNSTEIIVDLI